MLMRIIWGGLLGAILSTGAALGQVFERGYVVTAAGDTLRGEIENRFWQAPPESVLFRPAPDVPGRTYLRRQLRAFRLEGGRYFRAEVVPLDRGARTQVNGLPQRLVVNQRSDSLLVEVLVDGAVPLLRVVIDGVTHYLVRRPGRPYLELTERKYLVFADGRERVVNANNYQSQLTVYFGDCPAAVAAAKTAAYTFRDLAALVQVFSVQCTVGRQPGREYLALARPHRPFAFNGGLLAGGAYNRLSLKLEDEVGEEEPLLRNLNLDGRLHPLAGLYLDVLLPGRRWAGHGEASFSTYGRRGTRSLAGGAGSYTWYGTLLNTRLGARYVLQQTPGRELFVGSGLNFNISTGNESQQQYGTGNSRVTTRNVRVPTRASFVGPLPLDAGLYLEAGARWNRLTLSLDAGVPGVVGYTDPLAVRGALRDPAMPNQEVREYSGYSYSGLMFVFRTVLAYRLGQRPDQPVRQ